jgi:class 3 adenylate cyclase
MAKLPVPTGVVSLLFSDIENSTSLWESEPEKMSAALVTNQQ